MKSLVKYTPKKSRIVKDAEELNTKRDMRKKTIKSNTNWPDLKKRIIKHETGGSFLDYEVLDPITFDVNPTSFLDETYEQLVLPHLNTTAEVESEDPSYLNGVTPNSFHTVQSNPVHLIPYSNPVRLFPYIPSDSQVFDPQYGLMKQFVDIATEENIPIRVTSAYRPGAITSNGSPSWHSKGLALDITPAKGSTWEELKLAFMNSPRTLKWLRDNDFGILDETTPEMLAKTGGTGAHWHIGKDKAANRNFFKNGGVFDLNDLFFKPKEYVKDDKPSYLDYFNQFISKPMSSNYNTKFETKDFNKFATTMKSIYEEVLQELGLPKHNLKNLVRQDALESNYGLNAKNYNLGGIKYRDSDGKYKLKDFNNLKEYAMYKVKLLDKYYDAIKTPENNFIAALHGNNKDNRHYNDNIEMYKAINYMKSLDKYL